MYSNEHNSNKLELLRNSNKLHKFQTRHIPVWNILMTTPSQINKLLNDLGRLDRMQELAETGASIGTIEAILQLSPGLLRKWLTKGAARKNTPYRVLFNHYRKWVGEARALAESQQLAKTPTQWLERNTSAKLLNTDESESLSVINVSQVPVTQIGAAAVMAALKLLSETKVISLDEAAQKNAITIEVKDSD